MAPLISLPSCIPTQDLTFFAAGLHADVAEHNKLGIAIKVAKNDLAFHEVERAIYEQLASNPNILHCYGETEVIDEQLRHARKALAFELHTAGTLSEVFQNPKAWTGYASQQSKWPLQLLSALAHTHNNGVIHGDIGSHNILVSANGSLILMDFGGSRLNGSKCLSFPSPRYRRSKALEKYVWEPDERDDLFALGTVLYEICTGRILYDSIPAAVILERTDKRDFPSLALISQAHLRYIIEHCWHGRFNNAGDALRHYQRSTSSVGVSDLTESQAASQTLAELSEYLPVRPGNFDFLQRSDLYSKDKPYYCSSDLQCPLPELQTNLLYDNHQVDLHDIRGWEHELKLEEHGIELVTNSAEIATIGTKINVLETYMEDMVALLKARLGAECCICYDYRFRRASSSQRPLLYGSYELPDEPATHPHVDQTHSGAERRIARHLTLDEKERYLTDNFRRRIINAWRPLYHKVSSFPFAFCDPSSISVQQDLMAADRVASDYVGEVYYVFHNVHQKWYWLSDQAPEEMFLFVSSDSRNPQNFIPHASFAIENRPDTTLRESIELRFIVINRV